VKLYVKRGKTDAVDAGAIAEAVTRPSMRFVPVKTEAQQEVLLRHRTRDLLGGICIHLSQSMAQARWTKSMKETTRPASRRSRAPRATASARPSGRRRSATACASVPDARTALDQIAGGFDDGNENPSHSGLRMRSPREFGRAPQNHRGVRLNGGNATGPPPLSILVP
jgi:hypothetical protein